MKRLLLIHPFFFSTISALIMYISLLNVTVFISPRDVITPSILAFFVGMIIYLIGFAITQDLKSAAVFASIMIMGLLYLQVIFYAILGITILSIFLIRFLFKKAGFNEINLVLTTISISLTVFYLVKFIGFSTGQKKIDFFSIMEPVTVGQDGATNHSQYPDIYYIILDGYGRTDMLQTIHGYDNSAFISDLESRGFVVSQKSQSNYQRTILSLASSLNMQYLDVLSSVLDGVNLWWPVSDIIQHNELRRFLEQEGYQTVFFASGWDLTDIRDGSYYMSQYPITLKNFQSAYFMWTNLKLLSGISQTAISLPSDNTSRSMILYSFETLPEVASFGGPKFVFAHILNPHPPFLFDSEGKPVNEDYYYPKFGTQVDPENVSKYREGYLGQLINTNRLTMDMIDGILANSATPPVIIIQGDHGPDVFMNGEDPDKACLYERYSILNAYYLPGASPAVIPEGISPVNSFRLIINRYFGKDLPMLPDLQFYSPDSNIFDFQDVSLNSKTPCEIPESSQP